MKKILLTSIFIFFVMAMSASATDYPDPIINEISPQAVIPGKTILSIKGTNFGDRFYSKSILLGETEILEVELWSDTEVKFLVPDTVVVERLYLSAGYTNGFRSDYLQGPIYYIQPEVFNYSVSTGAADDEVTIIGKNFKNNFISDNYILYGIEVYINDLPTSILAWGQESITIKIPKKAVTGSLKVKVFSKDLNEELFTEGPVFNVIQPLVNDEFFLDQEYLTQSNIPAIWEKSKGDKNIIVAVIDDGIYFEHPDLKDNIWVNTKEIPGNGVDDDDNGFIDDYKGWNFVKNNSDLTAKTSHGTMVSGIIGAKGDNDVGVAGVTWNVRLMSLIVCDTEKYCDGVAVEKAIRYAVDNGANIINLSLGTFGTTGYGEIIDDVIEYAYNKGAVIVAGAGNGDEDTGEGVDLDKTPQSPVCNDGGNNMVLGVGSVDKDGKRAKWSNYGSCVDVWVRGTDMFSTSISTEDEELSYATGFGTSFSAPLIAGVSAILKSIYLPWTNTQIINTIIKSVTNGVFDAGKLFDDFKPPVVVEKNDDFSVYIEDEKSLVTYVDSSLTERLKGSILLQVEAQGQAWYVESETGVKYFLGRPADAFSAMRALGLGVIHSFMEQSIFPDRVLGKILIDVEDFGKAYYIYPKDKKSYYLGRPADAFEVMRNLGLGISNDNLRKIEVGELN